jgi:hypothetical protein
MKTTTLTIIVDGVIALAIVAAATVLLALHDLSESTAISLISVGVVLVGGSAKALLALKVPAPAQPAAQPVVQPAPPPVP